MNNAKWHTQRAKKMDLYNAIGDGIWQACDVLKRDPKSAIDFGSSIGALLSVLPVDVRRGLDYSPDALHNAMIDDIVLIDLDDADQMRVAINGERFDLIISQEVAEHCQAIRQEEAPQYDMPLVKAITSAAHANTVLAFGAAYIGQPGRGHISCRSARFWQCAFENEGWRFEHRATAVYAATLCKTMPIRARNGQTCCYLNTMMFTRRGR